MPGWTPLVVVLALLAGAPAVAQDDSDAARKKAAKAAALAEASAHSLLVPVHHPALSDVASPLLHPPIVLQPSPTDPPDPSPPGLLSDTPDLHWANGPPAYVHDLYFARSAWGTRVAVPPSDHPQQWRNEIWNQGPLWFVIELDGAPEQLLCLRWHGLGNAPVQEECQAMPAGGARLSFAVPSLRDWASGTYGADLVVVPDEDAAMEDGEALASLSFAAGGGSNTVSYIAGDSRLPTFAWPPPRFTSKARIDPQWLVAPDGTLGDAAERLDAAIVQAGYEPPGYYAIPGGFALATRMEQIEADGTPVDAAQRWSTDAPLPRITSLGDYLRALFTAPEGYYRVLVFTFTDQPVAAASVKASDVDAQAWGALGGDHLPDSVASLPFSRRHRCLVLVYEFQKRAGSDATPNPDGAPVASVHLQRSGILAALQP